ncbi:testis-specific serine/threonine-protein kinase 3-like [Lycorma delicatula]|uniref:testis-specific serine/threonine-protein kinase 3-like n=1 Tax=Lycorma delicatula TaxID=130591 RepID=UPI003F516D24
MTEADATPALPAPQTQEYKSEEKKSNHITQKQSPNPERKNTVLENHGYYLGRTIGSGSYAMVKVAESETHAGTVAIKIVSKLHAPTDYLRKFLPREIQVVKGLRHPNLIRFLQAIETTHRVYIIMEYAENGSLLDVIRKDNFIDEPRARIWFGQLVSAVEYCHDHGVVHRDIKCENLLIDSQQKIKLSDFGFARGDMGVKEDDFVLSDTFCGSYAYASPEILKGIPYRAQFSDVWSMGVVLFATVFGRLPFDDSNYNQLLKQVQKQVSFPKSPEVSTECKTLITKILAPIRVRIKIAGIYKDPWMQKTDITTVSTPKPHSSDSPLPVAGVAKTESVKALPIVIPPLPKKAGNDIKEFHINEAI